MVSHAKYMAGHNTGKRPKAARLGFRHSHVMRTERHPKLRPKYIIDNKGKKQGTCIIKSKDEEKKREKEGGGEGIWSPRYILLIDGSLLGSSGFSAILKHLRSNVILSRAFQQSGQRRVVLFLEPGKLAEMVVSAVISSYIIWMFFSALLYPYCVCHIPAVAQWLTILWSTCKSLNQPSQ